MGSEKEALGKEHEGQVPDAPPSYQDIDGAKAQQDGAATDDKAPPYDDVEKELKDLDSKPEKKIIVNQYQSLKIPFTADYLLGKILLSAVHVNSVADEVDPRVLAFELVCLVCFNYESECSCLATQPITIVRTRDLPRFKKPTTPLPRTAWLARELGKGPDGVQLAAAVAHSTWPAITLGMIPIFDRDSLVILRSRTMDKATHSREILGKISCDIKERPDLAGHPCKCCWKHICSKITRKWKIMEGSKEHKACTKTAYYVNHRVFMFIRLGCPSDIGPLTVIDMEELGHLCIPTADEQDFLFYCSLLPNIRKAPFEAKPKDPRQLSWDKMVISHLGEVLMCVRDYGRRLQWIYSAMLCFPGIPGPSRAVLRAESFGAGAGFLVMEIPKRPVYHGKSPYYCYLTTSYRREMNTPWIVADEFRSRNSAAQPVMRDCKIPQKPGGGWTGLSLDTKNEQRHKEGIRINYSTGLFSSRTQELGQPSWPRRGWICTGKCLKSGPVLAAHAGFTPPDNKTKTDTTVYVAGDGPMPWIVINQYATGRPDSFYIVDYRQCLACTVLHVPKGSIIGTGLPRNGSLVPGVEPQGITRDFVD